MTSEGRWSAELPVMSAGGEYAVTVVCEGGCEGQATIEDVTFGSVWYCFGQVGE